MSAAMVLYFISLIVNLDMFLAFVFWGVFLYFIVAIILTAMNRLMNDGDDKSKETQNIWVIRPFKKYYWILILSLGLSTLIPSEKSMYLMMGSKYLQDSAIPQKVSAIINEKLDLYLQDDKDKK